MGDRALVIFTDSDKQEISPTTYLHWAGSDVPMLVNRLAALMADRKNDCSYASARFTGICHEHCTGNLSVGLQNTPQDIETAIQHDDAATIAEYSHGDAGVIVVNAGDFTWKAYGGYLDKWVDGKEPQEDAA